MIFVQNNLCSPKMSHIILNITVFPQINVEKIYINPLDTKPCKIIVQIGRKIKKSTLKACSLKNIQ